MPTEPPRLGTPCDVFALLQETAHLGNQLSRFGALERISIAVATGLNIAADDWSELARC